MVDMKTYETSAKVEDRGEVRLSGVPFEPGTEVEVTISQKTRSADENARSDVEAWAAARDRMRELLRTATGFRNTPRISREDLYERGSLP